MTPSIGIDMVSIARIEQMIGRFGEKALGRFLNPNEAALVRTPATAAGFWAAKEAVSKALGCGIGAELAFADILLSKDTKGRPLATLSSGATARHGTYALSLSITHDGGFAVAAVLAYPISPKVKK